MNNPAPLRTAHHAFAAMSLAVVIAACGGRNLDAGPGPDDDDGGQGGMGGAAVGGFGGAGGAGQGGAGVGGLGEGGAGGQPPINPVECLTCVGQNCPEAVGCLTDQACITGLVCAAGQCLGGGSPDLMCVLQCFDGDLAAAQQALMAFGCIASQCSMECAGLLPF